MNKFQVAVGIIAVAERAISTQVNGIQHLFDL